MEDGPQAPEATPGEPQQRVYAPHDVAARLGISGAGLRRLSTSYERVHGPLPRDDRGRLWPEDAVERLETARAAVHEGRAVSVEQALRAPESAEEAAGRGDVPTAPAGAVQGRTDAVELLLEELRALRGAVEGMGGRLEALERENRELREQLQLSAPVQDRQEELEAPGPSPGEPAPQDVGPEQEAQPLKDWTADVQAQNTGQAQPQGGLWGRVRRRLGFGGR